MGRFFAVNINDRTDESRMAELSSLLSITRLQKAYKYRFERDCLRCLYGGIMVRYLLGQTLGPNFRQVPITEDAHGKPHLPGSLSCYFNLSHSGEWVVCGWDSSPLGVDVQRMESVDMAVARDVLADWEYAALEELEAPLARREYFFSLWVLKESYIKYTGEGLSAPLRAFGFDLEGAGPRLWPATLAPPYVALLHLDSHHKLGYCGETPPEPDVLRLTPDEIWWSIFGRI